jgi:hypothetical protein
LRIQVIKAPAVLVNHWRWSSFDERVVLQLSFDRARFLANPRDFFVQTLALACLVRGSDREKKLAYGSDCDWSARSSLVFGVQRYLFRI